MRCRRRRPPVPHVAEQAPSCGCGGAVAIPSFGRDEGRGKSPLPARLSAPPTGVEAKKGNHLLNQGNICLCWALHCNTPERKLTVPREALQPTSLNKSVLREKSPQVVISPFGESPGYWQLGRSSFFFSPLLRWGSARRYADAALENECAVWSGQALDICATSDDVWHRTSLDAKRTAANKTSVFRQDVERDWTCRWPKRPAALLHETSEFLPLNGSWTMHPQQRSRRPDRSSLGFVPGDTKS